MPTDQVFHVKEFTTVTVQPAVPAPITNPIANAVSVTVMDPAAQKGDIVVADPVVNPTV